MMALNKDIKLASNVVLNYHAPANLSINKSFTPDGEDNTFSVRTSFASYVNEAARDEGASSVPSGLDVSQDITQSQFNQLLTLLDTFAKAKLTGSPLAGATDSE